MKRFFAILVFTLGLLTFFSCTKKKDEMVVVAIDDRVFASDTFFSDVVETRFKNLSTTDKRKVVEEFARKKIVLLEAERAGIEQVEEISFHLRGLKGNIVVDKMVNEEVWEPILSDSSLKLLYDRLGREVGIFHIIITHENAQRTEAERSEEEALELAWFIKEKVDSGEMSFSEAARQFSEDPTAVEGGKLGYFSWGDFFEPLQSVAFALEPRQLSEPILSDFGYHLIWVVGIKIIPQPPFDEQLPKLKQFIRSGKGHEFQVALERFESRFKKLYRVHFNEDAIEILLRAIVEVHEGLEDAPKAEDILYTDINEIICTIDGIPYDINWLKERIETLDYRLSQSLIISQRALIITLEHIIYRFLAERYASESRNPNWFLEVDRLVKSRRFKILEKGLLDHMSKENPGASRKELIQSLLDQHRVTINDDFLSTIPEQKL